MERATAPDSSRRPGMRKSLAAMAVSTSQRGWVAPLLQLSFNLLTLAGLFLVNAAVVVWLLVLPLGMREGAKHPYLPIFSLGVLPGTFLVGLGLIPLGIWLHYRRTTRLGLEPRKYAPIGWANREFRRMVGFLVGMTGFNVLAGGHFSQVTVDYMDSTQFCGTVCHTMNPEYVAYRDSPHVNIACVECHIGSGRPAYMWAKVNGIRQVSATLLDRYPRPIPTPLENLRPARDICESCHWPAKFSGVQIRVIDHFASDSTNTYTRTVLALAVGGGGRTRGIHGFHVAPGIRIEYVADSVRQTIDWIAYTSADGTVSEYQSDTWRSGAADAGVLRTMDCLDCHTRPSHRFQMPERALDEALGAGRIDRTLPWIKREGLTLLEAHYADLGAAEMGIPAALRQFYQQNHLTILETRGAAVEQAGSALVAIYRRNVFPGMAVTWGTYADHSGHADFAGCFRCHGADLTTGDGITVSSDCTACHRILALRETDPSVIDELGLDLGGR